MPSETTPIGCRISQRVTDALVQHFLRSDNHDYQTLVGIVYGEIQDVADDQRYGDWIEAPDGTTWELTEKVEYPSHDIDWLKPKSSD
jgi:hypothetical protein